MVYRKRYWLLFLTVILAAITTSQINNVNTLKFSAKEYWETAISQGVMLENGSIVLNNQQLIEDDSPGFGFDSKPSSNEVLKKGIVIKKILNVERIPVKEAYVVALLYPEFPPVPNNGRHIVINVNGYETIYEVKHFWTNAKVPGSVIKKGENIITIKTLEPDAQFRTWIALDENYPKGSLTKSHAPGRSARSSDGGLTWNKNYIGELQSVKGEYVVRLKTIAYGNEGWIESPVVDLAQGKDGSVLKQDVKIQNINIDAKIINTAKTNSEVYFRSGTTLSPDTTQWSAWIKVTTAIDERMIKGRFAKVRIKLKSTDPSKSPSLNSISISTSLSNSGSELKNEYRILFFKHYPVRNSSFPFEYENPTNERVKALRAQFKLDSIVQGATTEFEKILLLKHWVAQQWQWHLLNPNEDIYEWDAKKILMPDSSGKIYGGFCLHYAIAMMQVLQSFGLQSRIVSADYSIWSGHEICEVWSNEFGKWIMLDANFDTYFVDKVTGIPLNTLELHDLFVKECFPNSIIDRDDWSREKLVQMAKEKAHNIPVIGMVGGGANNNSLKTYEWWNPIVDQTAYCGGYGPLTMGYLRLLPRANYLSQPTPTPINHGRTHWGWTGYYNWYDSYTPRAQEHEIFSNRVNDFYWNINQVGMSATTRDGGVIDFIFETNSPDFAKYEITVNNTEQSFKNNSFLIRSVRGMNRIEIRTVDSMGNKGTKSYLEYIYLPRGEQNNPQ
jgi:hypothetical protein